MFLIDSSVWIEFFTNGERTGALLRYMKVPENVVTPTIILYEVYKKIRRERTEEEALTAVSIINRTRIIDLSESIALFAADLSIKYSRPMGYAIVYATALENNCRVVTTDAHFRELDKVIFVS